jgi:hypothetical protein
MKSPESKADTKSSINDSTNNEAESSSSSFIDNRPTKVHQRKLQSDINESKTAQLMAAEENFKKKHTATSEADAIAKTKSRSGKWKINSLMDWGKDKNKAAFENDPTTSGKFEVPNEGWQIEKPTKGKGFRSANIEKAKGDFTGTATSTTDSDGKTIGLANHSDGWQNLSTSDSKPIT